MCVERVERGLHRSGPREVHAGRAQRLERICRRAEGQDTQVVLRGIRRAVENALGNCVRGRNAYGVLELIIVNVKVRGEGSPGDADTFAVQVHLAAEALTEEVRHQFNH